jgi:membrane protein
MLNKILDRIKPVFTKEFWNLNNASHSPRKKIIVKQIRIFSLAMRGFTEDRVQVRASALTYYTMLSIVPIAAMVFGIAKGFGIDDRLEEYVNTTFESQKEISSYILLFADKYLSNIKGGIIAGIGVIVLLWTVMRLLGNIELSFNDIWQIKKSRGMSRKLSDYISLIVIAPILLVASSGVTVFIGKEIHDSQNAFPIAEYLGPVLGVLTTVIPLILVWLVFTLLYIIMPNTKVKFGSAFAGGIIGGSVFQVFQWLYVTFQKQLFNYGEVYGSFAALPLFLIWLQLSWLIVLFGAEVAFANQYVEHYESESETFNISHHMKRIVSLMIVKLIAINFKEGIPPMTSEEIADKLDLPVRLVRDINYELLEVGIVSETITQNVKENAYQPAIDINKLSVSYVLSLLDKRGNDKIEIEDKTELDKMTRLVDSFSQEIEKSANNRMLVSV